MKFWVFVAVVIFIMLPLATVIGVLPLFLLHLGAAYYGWDPSTQMQGIALLFGIFLAVVFIGIADDHLPY